MLKALPTVSTETLKLTVRAQLILASVLLTALLAMTAWNIYATAQRTSFSLSPEAISVNPDVHLHLGQKIEMRWSADRADWMAAYKELTKHKAIRSNTSGGHK